jgi:Skp family chaperone for outer membrane proteins
MNMKSLRIPAFVVALIGVGVLAGTAVSQANFESARIGFVDVAEVFKQYSKAAAVEEDARKQLRNVDVQLRDAYDDLKKKKDLLDALIPDSQEYRDKKQEIDFEAFKLDYQEKQSKQQILENAAMRMNMVYTEIRNEADNYARRNGLDAVFMVNAKQIEAKSLNQLEMTVATRPVLYWNKSYDVTKPIIETLNSSPTPKDGGGGDKGK